MKRTIYLPEGLARRLKVYLESHPEETVSSVVQDALETKLKGQPADYSALLALAGIAKEGEPSASQRPEDDVVPEDAHSA